MSIVELDTTLCFKLVANLNIFLNLLMQADILVIFFSITPLFA